MPSFASLHVVEIGCGDGLDLSPQAVDAFLKVFDIPLDLASRQRVKLGLSRG